MSIAPLAAPDTSHLPALPDRASETIQKILNGEILGASRSIRLINEAFCIQADASREESGKELAGEVRQWAEYLIQTRGTLSPGVGNAIQFILSGLEQAAAHDDVDVVRAYLHAQTERYNQHSLDNAKRIVEIGANLLRDGDHVM